MTVNIMVKPIINSHRKLIKVVVFEVVIAVISSLLSDNTQAGENENKRWFWMNYILMMTQTDF
jgi:hypothetical protein